MSRQVVLALTLLLLVPPPAVAQSVAARSGSRQPGLSGDGTTAELDRVELWGGPTVVGPRGEVTLVNSYSPFLKHFSSTGLAGHTALLEPEATVGFEFGFNYFPTPHLGVQVSFGQDTVDLAGPSGPYTVHLEYEARYPPDYLPRPVVIDRSTPWPDLSGEVRHRTLNVNAVGRWALSRFARAEVSGGLSYVRVDGSVRPLAYSTYWLGGHSVLFSEVYELEVAMEPSSSVGINAGGGLDFRLGRHLSLTTGLRYVRAGEVSAPLGVSEIVNLSSVAVVDPVSAIQEALDPAPLAFSPHRVRVIVGLKAGF